jgi:hypothetical protein
MFLDGKDGTREHTFSSVLFPPKGSKYIKYQVLTKSTNPVASRYILDNVKFEEIIFPNRLKDNFMNNLEKDTNQNVMIVKSGFFGRKA